MNDIAINTITSGKLTPGEKGAKLAKLKSFSAYGISKESDVKFETCKEFIKNPEYNIKLYSYNKIMKGLGLNDKEILVTLGFNLDVYNIFNNMHQYFKFSRIYNNFSRKEVAEAIKSRPQHLQLFENDKLVNGLNKVSVMKIFQANQLFNNANSNDIKQIYLLPKSAMIKNNISFTKLIKDTNLSNTVIYNFKKNQIIRLSTYEKIMQALGFSKKEAFVNLKLSDRYDDLSINEAGYAISTARKKVNLTQDELAKSVGIHKLTLFKIENGEDKNFTLDKIIKIAKVLKAAKN